MRIIEEQETGLVVHIVNIYIYIKKKKKKKNRHLKIIAIIILKFEQCTKPRQCILRHQTDVCIRSSLMRFFIVCNSIYILWMHYSIEKSVRV